MSCDAFFWMQLDPIECVSLNAGGGARWAWLNFFKVFLFFLKKGIDAFLSFGNITNADGDRRVTNCRRERGGSRRKSAQVEKRGEGPAQTQFATHQG